VTGRNGSGKSRFFSLVTEERARFLAKAYDTTERILCLSGTMHDKYAPSIYRAKSASDRVVYLGNKVNNNMVSDVAPFRTLSVFLLRKLFLEDGEETAAKRAVKSALKKLNFQDRIGFKFRYSKGRKIEVADRVDPEIDLSLTDSRLENRNAIENCIAHIEQGDITLSDLKFRRGDSAYGLTDLSSGEKQYALALLGVIYCGSPNCTVYYDEPENSLHPSWQMGIVRDLVEILESLFANSTLIVATHSPLVASSVRGSKVYTCDFPAGQSWDKADLFGKASDSVLRDQFHLYSSRSPEVYKSVNRCLDLIARMMADTPEFEAARNHLESFDLKLDEDDALHDVIHTILEYPKNGEN
jgi:energy-coupling factor transporter ATP-binding protein EcfA2